MTHPGRRRLVGATAALFALSTLFPIVAAIVRPEPTPRWAGIADVVIALLTAALALTLVTRGSYERDDAVVRAAFHIYRGGATVMLVLLAVFFVAGDRIDWTVLLVGLAWRAWLLVLALPAALAAWCVGPRR